MLSTDRITITPVAFVRNDRLEAGDDHWGNVISEIELVDELPCECLIGVENFSHLEIIFFFHQLPDADIVFDQRHPRDNMNYPLTGILAQRGRARPNKLGSTIVELVERKKSSILVKGLDAIHGTPVVDIKPVMKEFLPRTDVKQPEWSSDLMKNYWK